MVPRVVQEQPPSVLVVILVVPTPAHFLFYLSICVIFNACSNSLHLL